MSKELTEQWYNGTLEESMYYVKLPENDVQIANIYQLKQLALVNDDYEIEVLEPVPSYDEFVSLKKLEFVADAIISGEKMEWENIVKRGNRKEMAKWINERKNKTVDGLQKKLKITTKALNDILNDGDDYWDKDKAQQALTQMEGVK